MSERTVRVSCEILDERARQDAKWGEQNHALPIWLAVLTKARGEGRKMTTADVRGELLQVAAVAVAAIEYIDRHAGLEGTMLGMAVMEP